MTTPKDGGPAFPTEYVAQNMYGDTAPAYDHGMSLRDWFAGQAINGIVSNAGITNGKWDALAAGEIAYRIADAMLKARDQ